jgi:hypothetical protein
VFMSSVIACFANLNCFIAHHKCMNTAQKENGKLNFGNKWSVY